MNTERIKKPKPPLYPESLEKAMAGYRNGLPLPVEYVEYHKGLAEAEINRLKELGFREVEGTREMKRDCLIPDGMMVLSVQMVKSNGIYNLTWHDSTRQFFVPMDGGGSVPLNA